MQYKAVIFDMDGLLIDSEPLWKQAADNTFGKLNRTLTEQEYVRTTGLRTKEFVEFWLSYFELPDTLAAAATTEIISKVTLLIQQKGKAFDGVPYIFSFFKERGFKIGLASSSPLSVIEVVTDMLQVTGLLDAVNSASDLDYGKPHPQVYLDCANKMNVRPQACICFEDSVNGMIAAKAAKMTCVVVPDITLSKKPIWSLADLQLSSLKNFNQLLLSGLNH